MNEALSLTITMLCCKKEKNIYLKNLQNSIRNSKKKKKKKNVAYYILI